MKLKQKEQLLLADPHDMHRSHSLSASDSPATPFARQAEDEKGRDCVMDEDSTWKNVTKTCGAGRGGDIEGGSGGG